MVPRFRKEWLASSTSCATGLGVVIGIFLHISTTILFESSSDHKFTMRKIVAVLLGIGIALAGFLGEM